MQKLKLLTLPLFAAGMLIASACVFGGDEDAENGEGTVNEGLATATQVLAPSRTPTPSPQGSADPSRGAVRVTYVSPFIWPADGPITSLMGPEHPNGIDIGLDTGGSMTVRAAAGGTVLTAGGSEDDALGLSIVISHGNGITTTYGHLSEVRVVEGSEVAIGETIGVGGSTGISNGNHLHFEVRQDGQTVDPMDVLPDGSPDTVARDVICANETFTVPGGSRAQVDLALVLSEGEEVVSARAVTLGSGRGLGPTLQTRSKVILSTPIDFDTLDVAERYRLELEIQGESESRTVSCNFAVQHRNITTTFYARATATPEPTAEPDDDADVAVVGDEEGSDGGDSPDDDSPEVNSPEGEPDAEATSEPISETAAEQSVPAPTSTPEPTATSPAEPRYSAPGVASAPGSANPTPQAPSYQAPGSSGPVVQEPSFSGPGSQ